MTKSDSQSTPPERETRAAKDAAEAAAARQRARERAAEETLPRKSGSPKRGD